MKKISTRRVPKLLIPIQCANRLDCCQELLQVSEVNPDNNFARIVIGDEIWVYYYAIPSVNKKSDEELSTRLHRTRPVEKIMMIIFWELRSAVPTIRQ